MIVAASCVARALCASPASCCSAAIIVAPVHAGRPAAPPALVLAQAALLGRGGLAASSLFEDAAPPATHILPRSLSAQEEEAIMGRNGRGRSSSNLKLLMMMRRSEQ